MLITLTKVLQTYEIQKGENFKEEVKYFDSLARILTESIDLKFIKRALINKNKYNE
jgi:hypothetical protein